MNDNLHTSIIRFIRKRYPYLIFFLLSLVPFAWHSNLFQVQFIGSADYLSPYVTPEWIAQTTSVYGPQVGGGGDYAYLLAYLFLYNLPVLILHTLGMSGPVISISILATMLFVSQLSMFLFVKYVIQEKLQLKNISISLLTTFGTVLYGFSPYLVGIIAPGHIFQIYSYMTFPLLLLFTDKFLSSKQYKWKYLISLYYIFFLSSPAYANIGILYVVLLVLGVYYLLFNILFRKKILNTTIKTCLIFISTILANVWWILPYAANFGQALTINQASLVINEAVSVAVKHATIANIFFGRAESLFFEGLGNTYYSNKIIFFLFTGLLLLAFIPYITRAIMNAYLYILSILLLLGAFISKGPNDPFGFLFNWMYYTIPGFQIFRRPVSKFYWLFLLVFFTLSIIGAAFLLKKSRNKYISKGIIGFLSLVCIYFVIAFIKTPLLVPFSVPEYYLEAKQYLKHTNAQRILILPGFYGTYPTYNNDLNNYYGVDFIPYIWPYQIMEPNSTVYGVGSPTKNEINDLVDMILENNQFCSMSAKLGISHIVVREDIDPMANTENTPMDFITVLESRPEVHELNTFTNETSGITIFRLNENCKGRPLLHAINSHVQYFQYSPSQIVGTIKSSTESAVITLVQNETNQWHLYSVADTESFSPVMSIFGGYNEFSKIPSDNGAKNIWEIPPSSNDAKFVLFYQSQAYFYIGLAVLAITNVIIISLVLYAHDQRNHSKSGK